MRPIFPVWNPVGGIVIAKEGPFFQQVLVSAPCYLLRLGRRLAGPGRRRVSRQPWPVQACVR